MTHIFRIFFIAFFSFLAIASASEQERLANWERKCSSYGFRYGTPEMAQCIERSSRNADAYTEKMLQCNAAYGFGTRGYNVCMGH